MNEVASTIPIAEVVLTRMSPGGPLRQMSASKVSSTFLPVTPRQMPYGEANLTFAGRYVCDGCVRTCKGVRRQDDSKTSRNGHPSGGMAWFCDSCLNGKTRVTRTPEQREVRRAATAARFALARQSRLDRDSVVTATVD